MTDCVENTLAYYDTAVISICPFIPNLFVEEASRLPYKVKSVLASKYWTRGEVAFNEMTWLQL